MGQETQKVYIPKNLIIRSKSNWVLQYKNSRKKIFIPLEDLKLDSNGKGYVGTIDMSKKYLTLSVRTALTWTKHFPSKKRPKDHAK